MKLVAVYISVSSLLSLLKYRTFLQRSGLRSLFGLRVLVQLSDYYFLLFSSLEWEASIITHTATDPHRFLASASASPEN